MLNAIKNLFLSEKQLKIGRIHAHYLEQEKQECILRIQAVFSGATRSEKATIVDVVRACQTIMNLCLKDGKGVDFYCGSGTISCKVANGKARVTFLGV